MLIIYSLAVALHRQPNHGKQAELFFHKPEHEILYGSKVDISRDDKKDEAVS